jgi:hypothetical protein
MADAYKTLYQGQLPNAAATLATVGGAKSWIVKHIDIVNTGGSELTFQLFRNGTTAAFAITPSGWTVLGGGKCEWDGTMALAAGETIAGVAGAASTVNVVICGDEVS